MKASFSFPDPFLFKEYPPYAQKNISAKTLSSPRLNSGENTGVFVIVGQSNSANCLDGVYTPSNPDKIDNLNIHDGGVYKGADPLLGCTNDKTNGIGNLFTRCADKVISTSVFQRVILVPISIGGSSVSDWKADGIFNPRIRCAVERLKFLNIPITAFLWMQGETDAALGTSQSFYANALQEVISTPRNIGVNSPWLIGLCSYNSNTTSDQVRNAQASVLNGSNILLGADTDTLSGSTYRQSDGTHLNVAGGDSAATKWRDAIDAVF